MGGTRASTSSSSTTPGRRTSTSARRSRRVAPGTRLHPARADRRGRADRALELPAAHGRLEARRRRSRPATPAILKPASYTPLTAIRLAELALEAGIPPGVVNVVTGPGGHGRSRDRGPPGDRQGRLHGRDDDRPGDHAAGRRTTSRRSASSWAARARTSSSPTRTSSSSPREAPYSVFDNCGQDCSARSRILVERSVHDRVVELFAEATRKVMVGDPTRRRHRGRDARQRASSGSASSTTSRSARTRAASSSSAGSAPDDPALAGGAYLMPTVFDDVPRRHADRPGGDLRARGVDHPVRHRGRGRPARERHAVRPVRIDLDARHRPGAARARRRSSRA